MSQAGNGLKLDESSAGGANVLSFLCFHVGDMLINRSGFKPPKRQHLMRRRGLSFLYLGDTSVSHPGPSKPSKREQPVRRKGLSFLCLHIDDVLMNRSGFEPSKREHLMRRRGLFFSLSPYRPFILSRRHVGEPSRALPFPPSHECPVGCMRRPPVLCMRRLQLPAWPEAGTLHQQLLEGPVAKVTRFAHGCV